MGAPIPVPASFYTPLDEPSREIRLIELSERSDPNDAFAPLRCNLIRTSLDDLKRPEYEALSYCWGDPKISVPISVNGVVVHITANLAAALQTIRDRRGAVLPIWADALCINQHDLAEKSCQVNMMTVIFSRARQCLIWLGETCEPPTNVLCSPNSITQNDVLQAFGLIESLARDEHYSEWRSGEGEGDLAPLISLPWWHRIWTVQEAALSQECMVICGSLELPWTQLVAAARNFQKHHHERCCARAVSSLKIFREKVQHIEHAREGVSIGTLFQMFRNRGATDGRDKVFGLLALGASDIQADYQVALESVYTQATRTLVAQTGSLKILLRAREYERNKKLPSWVPDLEARCDRHRTRELVKWDVWDLHDACAGRPVEVTASPNTDVSSLTLTGVRIDTIARVGAACLDHDPFSPPPEGPIPIAQPFRQWWQLVEKSPVSRTNPSVGLERRKAFMRVMSRDCVEEVSPPNYQVTWRRILPAEVEVCLQEVEASRTQRRTYFASKAINYRFLVTEGGLFGVGPADSRVGDAVFVLYGGRLPFVLRPSGASWTFLGDAFVDGIMDGQGVDDGKKELVTMI